MYHNNYNRYFNLVTDSPCLSPPSCGSLICSGSACVQLLPYKIVYFSLRGVFGFQQYPDLLGGQFSLAILCCKKSFFETNSDPLYNYGVVRRSGIKVRFFLIA